MQTPNRIFISTVMQLEGTIERVRPMYGKHFERMYTGSLVGAGAEVFALMGYVIANQKPPDFTVEINPTLVATILGEPEHEVEKALEFLCSPDPKSRSEKEEGRRLVKRGAYLYHVVNGEAYHGIKSQEELRAYWREKKRQKKESEQQPSPESEKAWSPTSLQLRLGKLFKRRETTRWDAKEEKAVKLLGSPLEDDLRLLEAYYTASIPKDQDYRRHDLITLLNNFNGEIDRARKFKPPQPF